MPKISQQKKDKIAEQILHYLFSVSPETKFTSDVAKEIARDEEFVKTILIDLNKKKFIIGISKNSSGKDFKKRKRWRLSESVYKIFSSKQKKHNNLSFEDKE